MRPLVTMREALADPHLLGHALPGPSWLIWRALLIAAMGEELTDEEREGFTAVTGREREPLHQVEEFWAIGGRRSGKTRASGTAAAYVGALCDHSASLAPGERGVIPILAASTTQALRAFQHTMGVLEGSPTLRGLVEPSTSEIIRLSTGIDVEIRPANFRTIRGITAVAAIGDEVSFWSVEGSRNPDGEILTALRPALATTGGPLWVISSPYAKRGELYRTYRSDFGPTGDPLILVAKGSSRTFNSTLPQSVVDRAMKRDPEAAKTEYGGEFRGDIAAFVDLEVVEACVSRGVRERLPFGAATYRAWVDPSGGAQDAMTLAVGHREGDRAVLDAVRERKPPFSPEQVVEEFCGFLKTYRITTVTGDRYAGEWPREQFRKHGIEYEVASRPRSDLYRDFLPMLTSGTADLLDNDTLVQQIAGLERRVARGGRDSIDHAPGAHDDIANACSGVLTDLAVPVQETTVLRHVRFGAN